MKSFRDILKEMKETRTQEEINADSHLYDLIMLDQDWRREEENSESFPLEANGKALSAIRNYYLGMKHPDRYPQHANMLKQYKQQWMEEVPHLSAFIDPH